MATAVIFDAHIHTSKKFIRFERLNELLPINSVENGFAGVLGGISAFNLTVLV